VAGAAGGVHDRGAGPVQRVQRREHPGLVVFDGGEQVVGFLVFHEVAGGFPLDVQRVRRDQRPGDIPSASSGLTWVISLVSGR
jgi:hypothetical protein